MSSIEGTGELSGPWTGVGATVLPEQEVFLSALALKARRSETPILSVG